MKEFIHFLHITRGSVYELDTQLEFVRRLQLGDRRKLRACESLRSEVSKLIAGLIRSLRAKQNLQPEPSNRQPTTDN